MSDGLNRLGQGLQDLGQGIFNRDQRRQDHQYSIQLEQMKLDYNSAWEQWRNNELRYETDPENIRSLTDEFVGSWSERLNTYSSGLNSRYRDGLNLNLNQLNSQVKTMGEEAYYQRIDDNYKTTIYTSITQAIQMTDISVGRDAIDTAISNKVGMGFISAEEGEAEKLIHYESLIQNNFSDLSAYLQEERNPVAAEDETDRRLGYMVEQGWLTENEANAKREELLQGNRQSFINNQGLMRNDPDEAYQWISSGEDAYLSQFSPEERIGFANVFKGVAEGRVSAVTNEMNNQLTNTLVNATRQRSEGNLTRPLDLSVIDRWTWASDDEKNRWKVNFANFNTSLMVPEEVIDNGASQIVSDANFNELMILAERDQQEFGYKLNEYYTQGTITDAQYRTLLNSKEDGIFNVLRFSEMEPQLEAYMDSMGIRDSNYDSVMSQVNTLARRFVQDQLLSYEPGSNQPPLTSELVSDYMKNQIAIINGRTITSMGNVLNRTMGLGLTYSTRTNRDALAVSREIADGHRFYSIGNDPQEAETMKVFYQNHEDLRRGFNTVLFGATQLSEDFNNAETEIDPSTGYPIQKIYTQGRPYLENSRYAGTSNYGTSMIVTRMVPGIANDPVTGQWTLEVWNPQNERWENGSQGFLAEQRWVSPSQVRGTGSTNTSPPQRTRDPEQAARGGFVEDAPATTGPSIWIMGVEVKGGVIDDLIYNSW